MNGCLYKSRPFQPNFFFQVTRVFFQLVQNQLIFMIYTLFISIIAQIYWYDPSGQLLICLFEMREPFIAKKITAL